MTCRPPEKLGDIRRASSLVSNLDVQFSAKLLDKGASRRQVGKAPPKIDLGFFYNSPSVPHLNVSRFMKMHHPAAQLDIQFVGIDGKFGDVMVWVDAVQLGGFDPPLAKRVLCARQTAGLDTAPYRALVDATRRCGLAHAIAHGGAPGAFLCGGNAAPLWLKARKRRRLPKATAQGCRNNSGSLALLAAIRTWLTRC